MFELNQRYTLDMPKGSISQKGIEQIAELIRSQKLLFDAWRTLNPETGYTFLFPLPDNWQWVWVVTGKGDYVGTFPKRLGKYYYKQMQIKCPPEFLQEIGNIARQHTEENPMYRFEFVNRFNWKAGDFGDKYSCYWGGNSEARNIIEDNGGMAIRFYDLADKGFARAWIAPIADGRYIVFNGYGFEGNPTLIAAHVMATFLGLSYRKIYLSNHESDTGELYINSGIGYLIGQTGTIEHTHEYDLEWGDCDLCYDCGRAIAGDNLYRGIDDEYYCENCYYERFSDCDDCGSTCYRDELRYIEFNGRDVCEYCLERHYLDCENCNEFFPRDRVVEIHDRLLCENCRNDIEPDDEPEPDEPESE